MEQAESACSFEARESESQSKRKRSSTSLPIGEGQRRVRGRPASPRAKPTLVQPSALGFRSKTLCSDASHSREAHVPSANLMAASSNMKRNYYHVFLSFRGPDVRHGFLSHLYAALDQRGIHTFVDREELRKGEQISPALMRAIEESRIAIIVFSENYASSPWCLEELLKIMECKEQNDLMVVFPVFYKVEPREVRGGRESYKRAMDNHESKFGKDSEKVKRWKKALSEAGSLSGWELNDSDDEAELIQSIINELSSRLRPRSLYVAKYPVGIESQVQNLISLSEQAGSDVLMIGLWGPGGIGKTTIAKALYNAIENQFQGCSFLERVREKSNQSSGLVALQEQLLSEIFSCPEFTVYTVDRGISLIQERLCRKKVLLVLDDIDDMDQLNALAGKGDWFGKGSRIIVTSRDRHLLTSYDKNYVHEVKILEDNEAQDLFGQHAFTNSNKVEIRRDLIDGALHYAGGLPLALEVLGSFLRGRKEPEWKSTLHKLSKIPESKINRVLRISFDGLDENDREIFLDIACFFKGKSIKDIKEVLDSCDFDTTIGMEILIERSLIKNELGYLQMHDLIQSMGQDIVKQECRDDPGKRSRLWLLEDVEDMFYHNTGTDAVKAIVLDLRPPEVIIISPDAFTNMKKLRILIFLGVLISSQAQVRLPNELRWLEWPNALNLEFGSGLNKLVRLDVPKSHIRQFGGNFQKFRKLKSINFSECKSLVSICDLSLAPNMEKLILNGSENLVEVHPSVGNLVKLEVLSLESCSNLSNFPDTLRTKSLQTLDLSGCSKFEKFPDIDGKMEHLKRLDLRGTAIKELPASIENLVSVESMNLASSNLVRFGRLDVPKSHISQLRGNSPNFRQLKSINFSKCQSLVSIHDLSCAPNVEKLILNGCERLKKVHPSVGDLVKLEVLSLGGCFNLRNFPNTLKTKSLQTLELFGCSKLEKFPDIDGKMEHLEVLPLYNTAIKELPASIENLVSVRQIDLSFCENLMRLPSHIYKLKNLESFCLRGCSNLITFPKYMEDSTDPDGHVGFRKLNHLLLVGCNLSEVEFLESFSSFPALGCLDLQYNKFAHMPTCINKYYCLHTLNVRGCKLLQEIPQLPPNINHLSAGYCKSLQKLPDTGGLSCRNLRVDLTSCCELFRNGVNMDDVANMSLLEKLPKMKDAIDIVLIGREMPKWIFPCEEDSISFMVPQDLYNHFKGLAFCVVLSPEEGKVVNSSCNYTILVNGQFERDGTRYVSGMESDHVWLSYKLLKLEQRLQNAWSHFEVRLRAEKGSIKKCGFRLICEQKEDDLRVATIS
ncbi:disease resistance protein RPV1 [Eucalyptus grandis]|uniref:disease resistance protein RPV1 n=1 Tax=Eucalyptus grandis TaxID=71139 RepID=UPI00192EB098|nr:disease resistance protein RPV1 [Eucalyptus grandis]